ncbi:hypothetical protein MMPV_006214 [Pyropia vietnamensis]
MADVGADAASSPAVAAALVGADGLGALAELLGHPNVDVVLDALAALRDVIEAGGTALTRGGEGAAASAVGPAVSVEGGDDPAGVLVDSLLGSGCLPAVAAAMSGLDDTRAEHRRGILDALALVEAAAEVRPAAVAAAAAKRPGSGAGGERKGSADGHDVPADLSFLEECVARGMQPRGGGGGGSGGGRRAVRDGFDANRDYAVEVVAILLQSGGGAAVAFADGGGILATLLALDEVTGGALGIDTAAGRAHADGATTVAAAATDGQAAETEANLFDILCSTALARGTTPRLLAAGTIGAMLSAAATGGRRLRSPAIKVLSFALAAGGPPVAAAILDANGLGVLFGLLERQRRAANAAAAAAAAVAGEEEKRRRRASRPVPPKREEEEHLLSVLYGLFAHADAGGRARLLAKCLPGVASAAAMAGDNGGCGGGSGGGSGESALRRPSPPLTAFASAFRRAAAAAAAAESAPSPVPVPVPVDGTPAVSTTGNASAGDPHLVVAQLAALLLAAVAAYGRGSARGDAAVGAAVAAEGVAPAAVRAAVLLYAEQLPSEEGGEDGGGGTGGEGAPLRQWRKKRMRRRRTWEGWRWIPFPSTSSFCASPTRFPTLAHEGGGRPRPLRAPPPPPPPASPSHPRPAGWRPLPVLGAGE